MEPDTTFDLWRKINLQMLYNDKCNLARGLSLSTHYDHSEETVMACREAWGMVAGVREAAAAVGYTLKEKGSM